jgi:hypothetical protein
VVFPDLCIAALKSLKDVIGHRGPQPQDLVTLRWIFGDQPTEHAALAMNYLDAVADKQGVLEENAEATRKKGGKEIYSRRPAN